MKTKDSTGNDQRGFTLMELVLAMGVCAIVLAAISGVFFSAVRLRDSATRAVDEGLPVQRTLTILQRDLLGVLPPATNGIMTGDFKVGDVASPGINQNVSIELYTTTGALHENEPWGDVQRVTYEVRTTAAGKNLVRSVARDLLTQIPPTPEEQVLMNDVKSVAFDCYDGTQWRTTWDTTASDTNLPVAVRANIQMAGDSLDRQPFILVVPLDAQLNTNQIQSVVNS
jgi:type II secretion system protein J